MRLSTAYLGDIEDIVKPFPDYSYNLGAPIEWHWGLHSQGPDIVKAMQVVSMGMCYKDSIGLCQLFPQHLKPELRGHVYDYICPLCTDIDRAACSVVPWIGGGAYRTAAADYRDAMRCSCP